MPSATTRASRVLSWVSLSLAVLTLGMLAVTLHTMIESQQDRDAQLRALAAANNDLIRELQETADQNTNNLQRLAQRNEVLHGNKEGDAPRLSKSSTPDATPTDGRQGRQNDGEREVRRRQEPAKEPERKQQPAPPPPKRDPPPDPPDPPEDGPVERVIEEIRDRLDPPVLP